jgi:hypothetical protein
MPIHANIPPSESVLQAFKELMEKLNEINPGTYGDGIYVEINAVRYYFNEQTGQFIAAISSDT